MKLLGLLVALAGTALLQDPRPDAARPAPAAPTPGAAAPQVPGVPVPQVPEVSAPQVPEPPVLDCTAPFDQATFEASLGRIAAAYPDLMRVRSLGKSRGGKDLWLAAVGDTAEGDPGRRPAALVITALGTVPPRSPAPNLHGAAHPSADPRPAGPEAVVFALASLLERARTDRAVRERLQRSTLYFLPAPDPDSAFPPTEADAAPAPRPPRLDRNFPAGWEPYDAEPGARGPYALCEPESRTLARFLLDRNNLSIVVDVSAAGPSLEAPKGAASARPAVDPPGAPIPEPPGSLEAFCRETLNATVVRAEPWTGAIRTGPSGTAPEGFFALESLLEGTLDELPRLECGSARIERLRPDLWIVDVPLSNPGRYSTFGRGSPAAPVGVVRLNAGGARVVACALRHGENESYEALRGTRTGYSLGHLEARATVGVRLVVQAEEGATVDLTVDSPRSGSARASVVLR